MEKCFLLFQNIICTMRIRTGNSLVAGILEDGRGNAPGQAEVGELDAEVGIDEDIGRLDVPVDVLLVVHVAQDVEELPEDALDLDVGELVRHVHEACEVV